VIAMVVETWAGPDELLDEDADEEEPGASPDRRLGHLITADERDEDLFAVLGSEHEEYAPEELAMHLFVP
jgi:hypothetical protein